MHFYEYYMNQKGISFGFDQAVKYEEGIYRWRNGLAKAQTKEKYPPSSTALAYLDRLF